MNRLAWCLALVVLVPGPAFSESKILVSAPSKSLTWFPAALAKEKGFYRDEGLDVDFVVMNPRLALQAVISGDAAYTTALGSTIRAAVRGLPLRIVLTICEKPHFALIAKPGISAVEQLRGKIVGISSFGASSDTMARAALAKYKLSADKDVKILAVGGGLNRLAALKSGAIDATLIEAPYNIMLEQEGFPRLLFVGDVVPSPIAGFGTAIEHMQKQSGEVRRMVRSALRAIQYAKANRRESVQAIARWTGMDLKLAEGSYEMAAPTWTASGMPGADALRAAMEEVQRELKLDRAPEPSQAFDWTFLKS
ncbi:MAG TPA: ABC transporter substrate-binding protein [Verrucomicrobiae bacterium]|nr:ABC transporter substrate-binding protein [Verrucomicrobiae bacterium]